MGKILFVSPTEGNGGIASWAKCFYDNFRSNGLELIQSPITKYAKSQNISLFQRIRAGLGEFFWVKKNILDHLNQDNQIKIIHSTTSGGLGVVRDIMIGRIVKGNNIKGVLHLHYGNLDSWFKRNWARKLLLKSFGYFDQIWVLDRKTVSVLQSYPEISKKVKLTPNSIKIPDNIQIQPKDYRNFIFLGNVIETKGVADLVEAFSMKHSDANLHIVGPADESFLDILKNKAGNMWENSIRYHGKMPNKEAVEFIKGMDVLVLPTYYSAEAFPISILEAMAAGKLVISTPRAAIPDMLGFHEKKKCGLLVPEKNPEELAKTIDWINSHKEECDEICRNAYEKARTNYAQEIVFRLYESNYLELIR